MKEDNASIQENPFVVQLMDEIVQLRGRMLVQHILAMASDGYLMEHPEWKELIREAHQLEAYLRR